MPIVDDVREVSAEEVIVQLKVNELLGEKERAEEAARANLDVARAGARAEAAQEAREVADQFRATSANLEAERNTAIEGIHQAEEECRSPGPWRRCSVATLLEAPPPGPNPSPS